MMKKLIYAASAMALAFMVSCDTLKEAVTVTVPITEDITFAVGTEVGNTAAASATKAETTVYEFEGTSSALLIENFSSFFGEYASLVSKIKEFVAKDVTVVCSNESDYFIQNVVITASINASNATPFATYEYAGPYTLGSGSFGDAELFAFISTVFTKLLTTQTVYVTVKGETNVAPGTPLSFLFTIHEAEIKAKPLT